VGAALERDIGHIWQSFSAGLPSQHSIEEQALFFVGYYQERYGKIRNNNEDGGSDLRIADEDASKESDEE